MSAMDMLDAFIGLIAIYLILSLIVTALGELFVQILEILLGRHLGLGLGTRPTGPTFFPARSSAVPSLIDLPPAELRALPPVVIVPTHGARSSLRSLAASRLWSAA